MSLHYHCVRCGSSVELGQNYCAACGAVVEKSFGYRCAANAALQGDPEGFTYLYESTYKDSLLMAKQYLNNDHEAEEVVQDAYRKAFDRLGSLQNPGEFPAWMEGMVADTASERSKKKQQTEGFFRTLAGRIAIIAGSVVIGGGLIGGGIALFNGHKNDPSSDTQVQTRESDEEDAASIEIAAGDYITFGSYEQDLNEDNKKEEIEWRVLSVDDDQVLLISDKILYITKFSKAITGKGPLENPSEAYPDWESSGIRKWLNEDFLKDMFSDEEQKMLVPRKTAGSSSDIAGEDPAQTDKVFFLSMEEAESYFASDQERCALATDYAWKQYYDIMQQRLQSPMLPAPEIIAEYDMPFGDFLPSHRTASVAWWLSTYSVSNWENTSFPRAAYFSVVRNQGDVFGQEVMLGTDGEVSGIGIRPSICMKKDAIDKDMVVNKEEMDGTP